MMQLIYPGPFDSVDVPAAGVTAVQGVPVDIPEPHAQSLIEQGWTLVRPKPKKEQ